MGDYGDRTNRITSFAGQNSDSKFRKKKKMVLQYAVI